MGDKASQSRVCRVCNLVPCVRLQNLPKFLLLLGGQARREVDFVLDDEVAALAFLLGDGHAEAGISVFAAWLRRAGFVEVDLLAVDGRDGSPPTREGFLQIQSDGVNEVVILALEKRMRFLEERNVSLVYNGYVNDCVDILPLRR